MGNRLILGGLFVVLGALIALVPQFIFPVCDTAQGSGHVHMAPMRCYWTARAELGVGGMIALSGLMLAWLKQAAARRGVSLMAVLSAVLAVALPLGLIGVCDGAMMPCRAGTLPALLVLGVLTAVAALGNAAYLRGRA